MLAWPGEAAHGAMPSAALASAASALPPLFPTPGLTPEELATWKLPIELNKQLPVLTEQDMEPIYK